MDGKRTNHGQARRADADEGVTTPTFHEMFEAALEAQRSATRAARDLAERFRRFGSLPEIDVVPDSRSVSS